jgi:hypothetical protein
MKWIREHKQAWRIGLLLLLCLAFLGPWVFDLIVVPAQYNCQYPNMRLHGDYCGVPLPGIWILAMLGGWFIGLFLSQGSLDSLRPLLLVLPLLPVISTLLLILRGDRKLGQVFQLVALVAALAFGLFLGLSSYPRLFWVLWGVWLYVVLAIAAITLEGVTLRARPLPPSS